MLPRSQRLSVEQFDAVMEKGRAVHSPLFVVRWLKTEEKTRISAAVPKKVMKTAVARNHERRRIYEAVKPFIAKVKEGIHGIVFAKSGIAEQKLPDMRRVLEEVFVKAGLIQ